MKLSYVLVGLWIYLMSAGALRAQVLSSSPDGSQGVVVDFQDADLRFVISALAEAASVNVVYGDLPAHRVTLRLTHPVPRAQVLPILRSTVESNGLRLVEEEGFVRVEVPPAPPLAPPPPTPMGAEGVGIQLFVYRLRHAQAPRLAATLQELFGRTAGPSAGSGTDAPMSLSQALREQRVPPPGGVPNPRGPGFEAQPGGERPGTGAMLQGAVQIVPDELTNSLLVRAVDADWQVVRHAIEALDLRPLQVLIEAHIVEVRRSSDFELSLHARGTDRSSVRPEARIRSGLEGRDLGGASLELVRVGPLDVNVALSALSSRGTVRILSRPVITAQNNQEARILVGSERPFIQVFRTLPTDNGTRDQIVQYRDVGTSLTVTPTVNTEGYVNLRVVQEVSSATGEQQFGAPVISTREASTMLYIKDGQTAIIGGLIDRQQERTRGGIPILKDLPLLGMLFGSTRRTDTYSELFLLLTPHVVATDEDLDRIRKAVESATRKIHEPLPALEVVPRSAGEPEVPERHDSTGNTRESRPPEPQNER